MIFDGIRYRNPFIYRIILGLSAASLISAIMISSHKIYKSEILNDLRLGLYYQIKATFLDGRTADWISPQSHFSAIVIGYAKGGALVLKKPTKSIVQAQLADLIITDEVGVARYIRKYVNKTVYVDYYEYDSEGKRHSAIIVWKESGEPMNLSLIDSGLAKPITNPPTNIVHQLFAEYYLGKVFQ